MPVEVWEGTRLSRSEKRSIGRGGSSSRITMPPGVLRTRRWWHLAISITLTLSGKDVPDSRKFSMRVTGFVLNRFISNKSRVGNNVGSKHRTMPMILLAQ